MVLKNLFTGQQWRTDIENRILDMGRGEERVWCMEKVTSTRLLCPWDFPGKSTGVGCIAFSESKHKKPEM